MVVCAWDTTWGVFLGVGGRIGACNLCCTILEIYIFLVLFYQSVGACRATIESSEGVKRNTENDILGHTRDYVSIFNPRISVSHLHRSELDYQQTACTVARPIIHSNPTNQIKNQEQKNSIQIPNAHRSNIPRKHERHFL